MLNLIPRACSRLAFTEHSPFGAIASTFKSVKCADLVWHLQFMQESSSSCFCSIFNTTMTTADSRNYFDLRGCAPFKLTMEFIRSKLQTAQFDYGSNLGTTVCRGLAIRAMVLKITHVNRGIVMQQET